MTVSLVDERRARILELVAEILELEVDEITETDLFIEDHGADSLKLIDILGALEKEYKVMIDQAELANLTNLQAVYAVTAQAAGW